MFKYLTGDYNKKWKQSLLLLLILSFSVLICTIILKTPFIGSSDFIYYILNSRDLAYNVGPVNYAYFPGVQWMLSLLIQIFGSDLLTIQIFFSLVLVLGVGLLSGVVFLATRSLIISLAAGILHILFLHISEGFAGILEPFGILFILMGFFIYQIFLSKKKYYLAAIIFAFFAAMSIFTKQQCLVFLVAMPFLPFVRIKRFYEFHFLNLVVPILAVIFLVLLFYAQGGGLQGMAVGFATTQNYPSKGSFLENLDFYFKIIKPIWMAFLFSSALYGGLFALRYFKHVQFQVGAVLQRQMFFWVLSGVGFLFQFKIRWYPHYGLYLIPCLIIPLSMQISVLSDAVKESSVWGRRYLILSMVSFLLLFGYYRNEWKDIFIQLSNRDVASELVFDESVCAHVPSKEVLLIPSRGNAFHWFCKTVAIDQTLKYGWSTEAKILSYYQQLITDHDVKTLFVFNESFGSYEKETLAQPEWSDLHGNIVNQGFKALYESKDGILYHR